MVFSAQMYKENFNKKIQSKNSKHVYASMKTNVLGCLKVYTVSLDVLIFMRLLYTDFEKLTMQAMCMKGIFQKANF